MKVFVSSVIKGLEPHRDAVARAVSTLGHEPIRADKDYGASPESPQETCLRGVRDSDAVVLILGNRYGFEQESGLSATHEEFREAQNLHPIFAFVQQGVDFEPDQRRLVDEAQDWVHGGYTREFSEPSELERTVTRALYDYGVSQAGRSADETDLARRAISLVPRDYRRVSPALCIAIAGGPPQTVLRPSSLDSEALSDALVEAAMFGEHRVLDRSLGVQPRIVGDSLVLANAKEEVAITEWGALRIVQPALHEGDSGPAQLLPVMIEEEIRERIQTGLQYAAWVLDKIDRQRRISDIVPVVALLEPGSASWRTLEEHARSPNSLTAGRGGEIVVVQLSPASRKRGAILREAEELAEDFTVRLRRSVKPQT